jgi:putative cardiolipin synthase
VDINTECGLLIDSEELTRELLAYVKTLIRPENSWAVSRDARGRLTWSSDQGAQTKEPAAGFAAKLLSGISGVLPIQGQL